LKTHNDVLNIKKELLKLNKDSNIVIIGCGPTGSEMIGNLIDYNKFNIYAIDGLSKPLNMYSDEISSYVLKIWKDNNVNLYFNNFVNKIDKQSIYLNNNKINYDLAIWCGGIKKNQLTNNINNQLNNNCKFGIPVTPFLNVINNLTNKNYLNYTDNVYALGDCAYSKNPPTAQIAYQQGKYLADNFNKDFKNLKPFKPKNKGQICYIGDKKKCLSIKYIYIMW
jgi:NADH:ubiquinone reductase (non-electrogenic)